MFSLVSIGDKCLANSSNPQISRVFAAKRSYHSAHACSTRPESRDIFCCPSSLAYSRFRQRTSRQVLSCRGASNMNTRRLTTESQRQPHPQKHKSTRRARLARLQSNETQEHRTHKHKARHCSSQSPRIKKKQLFFGQIIS
jgi:hypothetical protein